MKKKLIVFMSIFLVISYGKNTELKDLKMYKLRDTGVVGEGIGSIDYILNNENSSDLIMYFRKNDFYRGSIDPQSYFCKECGNKEFLILNFFNKSNLDIYYSKDYNELKNKEKFLYGKFVLEGNMKYLKLELYFIDINNEEKKKIFFKKFDKDILFPILIKINDDKTEGLSVLPYTTKEFTLFTSEKIIHRKVEFSDRKETLMTHNEKKLYDYLLNLFKDEIPEEFFE